MPCASRNTPRGTQRACDMGTRNTQLWDTILGILHAGDVALICEPSVETTPSPISDKAGRIGCCKETNGARHGALGRGRGGAQSASSSLARHSHVSSRRRLPVDLRRSLREAESHLAPRHSRRLHQRLGRFGAPLPRRRFPSKRFALTPQRDHLELRLWDSPTEHGSKQGEGHELSKPQAPHESGDAGRTYPHQCISTRSRRVFSFSWRCACCTIPKEEFPITLPGTCIGGRL